MADPVIIVVAGPASLLSAEMVTKTHKNNEKNKKGDGKHPYAIVRLDHEHPLSLNQGVTNPFFPCRSLPCQWIIMAHGSIEFDSSPVNITDFVILLQHLLSAYFLKTL
ncbi:hypothetical protein [Acidithiobacillus ferrivorans]|uniref:Uncharacterized protein n=1 Tax=Acidithiobacillus ferrivorans TaxID=160808 RepID=A0A7T4WEY3_9PROT|nr:hypothetical protein [Acidithiobacillus ferrivorans]QQD73380.1 hypothetical protein H2515_03560 [Acidithiobacillus ferrivorans]